MRLHTVYCSNRDNGTAANVCCSGVVIQTAALMSALPEGWCWQLRITLPKNLRGNRPPEYYSYMSSHVFFSQAEAIASLEDIWADLKSLCVNCTWEDGAIELVLAPIPDTPTRARQLHFARGMPEDHRGMPSYYSSPSCQPSLTSDRFWATPDMSD